MKQTDLTKTLTGYCEPLSLRAGEEIHLMASSENPLQAHLDLVRIICGDPTSSGPGFKEETINSELPKQVSLVKQLLHPGSFAKVDLSGLTANDELAIGFNMRPSRPIGTQTIFSLKGENNHLDVVLEAGLLQIRMPTCGLDIHSQALTPHRWYRIDIQINLTSGRIQSRVSAHKSRSPARDLLEPIDGSTCSHTHPLHRMGSLNSCLFAASPNGEHFDGRIARPHLTVDGVDITWDLAQEIDGRRIIDVSGNNRHGHLHQLPARGVTGPDWDDTCQSWQLNPNHYDAIHFHADDLFDAAWNTTASLRLTEDLPSGIYAFRLRSQQGEDRIPFFVRPAAGYATAKTALLMSSCTYMAYANHRMLFEGADFVGTRSRLSPEHDYVRQHPEVGASLYEKHGDGSGVMYSSRNRPILQLRPGADRWNFTPDTDLNAFLDHLDIGHDVIADEDLHFEGLEALAPYRVIVTGTHPEYWSTAMLNALEDWQRQGGRLLYLGGNGFYWRVAFSDAWPGAIELRRAEDGVRNWQTEPGESYHSFNGEYGGLWRRQGRAPNELVGIGFAAQGFKQATHYQRNDASWNSRAAWIFEGVEDTLIGTSGLGGGAAGQEIDRYDTTLGSPEHALVLASATEFGDDMIRTKEEFEAAVNAPSPDPLVRADMVFYETQGGGAVFSVGSISWFGALAVNSYNNDVARITSNVLHRFIEKTPFQLNSDTQSKG
ncbi:MAG: hypothetical protein HOL98_10070 [Gammaproteobacteria bacterium]|nr:hypothetical protein [Gammaproteobacteria bacterium]MBT5600608.1 hypothetical protein [Gammaproteobacteria bacterium]